MVVKRLSISKCCTILFIAPWIGVEDQFPIRIVQDPFCFLIKCSKGDGDIEAILVIKDIVFREIIAYSCGKQVNILFSNKDIYFQIRIHENKNEDKERAYATCVRINLIFALI